MFSGIFAYLFAAGCGLGILFGAYLKGRLAGARRERENQAAAESLARDIAGRVTEDVDAIQPSAAREELRRWAR